MAKILVTGATGFLGRWLVRALLERGDTVRSLGRNPTACDALKRAGSEVAQVDLRDRNAVLIACAGMEAVCHSGALSAPWGLRSDFEAINVGGTENVIAGCRANGVQRLLYVSSPSVVFNGCDQTDLRETAPYPSRFISVYSETKKRGEDLVNQAAAQLETVILRPKAIFGPGDTSLLPRLLEAAKRNRLPQIGNGENRVDLTYVENVVDAILLALNSAKAVGKTYTITNEESPRLWDVIRSVLKALDYSADLRQIALPTAYAAAALMEAMAALTHREPMLTRYSVLILARTQTYNIRAAREDLGYNPRLSLADGITRTIEALRSA